MSEVVVRELYPETRGYFFRSRRCPGIDEARELAFGMDGEGKVVPLADAKARDAAAQREDRIFAVSRKPVDFSTVVLGVGKEDGYEWNYALEGSILITDHSKFLAAWARDEGACGLDGIDSDSFVHRVVALLEPVVRDEIAKCRHEHGYRISDIQEKDALPSDFWTNVFASVGNPLMEGLGIEVADKTFLSPNRELEEKMLAAAKAQRELENQAKAEFEAAVNGRAAEAELEKMDQQRKLAQLAFEKKQAELEAAIKKQRVDVAVYETNQLNEAKVRLQKALNDEEIRKQQALGNTESDHVKALSSAMEELVGKINVMTQKLETLGVAAEKIGEKASEVKVDPVVAPRYQGMSGNFLSVMQGLRNGADEDIVVSLEVARGSDGFATRDLVPMLQRHDSGTRKGVVYIGDKMTLRLKSPRSGYLTLFNFGTSGRVSKIFPYPASGMTQNWIDGGRVYMLPGELMRMPAWIESGPASSLNGLPECVVAILTEDRVDLDERCFGEAGRVLTRGGFAAVEESISSILDLPRGSWIWGMTRVDVEG